MKALIVDDSSTMRRIIVDALRQAGVPQVDEAMDGIDAIECCKKRLYDVILMDWNMPNMVGIDAVRAIRKLGIKTPIIMVTTETEKERVVEALQQGVNNYIVKPFRVPSFVEKVQAVLKNAPYIRPGTLEKASELQIETANTKKVLDEKYLNPITDELKTIFDSMLYCDVGVKTMGLADSNNRVDTIFSLVSFSGALKGAMGLLLPETTAIAMANKMLNSDTARINDELFDAMAELINIVGGRSKARLSEVMGETLELGLPLVIQGKYSVYSPANTVWTEVVYESDLGPFYFKITTEPIGIFA